eukprot:TRINITY_DN27531_c0_g1_i1.p1 TRINITY_DN27531_c0_g1~~TRINITY_DN27531_c0_g1_i1.p1  ORF type:complete len:154 (-),score=12.62 TRINITY_DN27531_c0_g1_i1:77-538(-)
MFPLIHSVSRLDPDLKQRTLRTLLKILQTSPPLSLAEEPEETLDEMIHLLKPSSQASTDSEAVNALLGLALQRGLLRHILASLTPFLEHPALEVDVQPYITTMDKYQTQVKLLSAISEDTFMGSWQHHPLPPNSSHSLFLSPIFSSNISSSSS